MTSAADFSRRLGLTRQSLLTTVAVATITAVILSPLWSVLLSTPQRDVVVNVASRPPVALDGAASPLERPTSVTLNNAAAVPLVPAAFTTPTSGYCVNASTTQTVWKVAAGATSTANGDGPYCADPDVCVAGPTLPIAGRAWAILGGGAPLAISCNFVDDGVGFGGGPSAGGGGGAPDDAAFILQAPSGDLANSRTLAAGSGISLVDTGPGGTVTVTNTGETAASCELAGDAACTMTGAIRARSVDINLMGVVATGDIDTGLRFPVGYGTGVFEAVSNNNTLMRWRDDNVGATTVGGYFLRTGQAGVAESLPNYAAEGNTSTGLFVHSNSTLASSFSRGGQAVWRWGQGYNETVALLRPATDDAVDLGTTSLGYRSLYVDTSIVGNTAAKSLAIIDDDAVQVSGSGYDLTVDQVSTFSQSTSTNYGLAPAMRLPARVFSGATTGSGGPTCAGSGDAGVMLYVDRTDDAVDAEVCVCRANAAGTYQFRRIDDFSVACDVVP